MEFHLGSVGRSGIRSKRVSVTTISRLSPVGLKAYGIANPRIRSPKLQKWTPSIPCFGKISTNPSQLSRIHHGLRISCRMYRIPVNFVIEQVKLEIDESLKHYKKFQNKRL